MNALQSRTDCVIVNMAHPVNLADMKIETKLSKVQEAAAAGDWRKAILLAAKFGELGAERDAILSAREAINRPEFERQMRRDPERLIAAGIKALKARYHL